MKLQKLQKELDIKKYVESAIVGMDLCGSYEYCKHCNKKNKYPCAAAFNKFKKEA